MYTGVFDTFYIDKKTKKKACITIVFSFIASPVICWTGGLC